ncbi:coiled-coil domain-containing protein 62, partial [Plakobranchus ocellatus]
APAIFLDSDIISKQREEIQLLMEELAGRDQELNDMVTSHQKQVRAWEADRDKLDSLQTRLSNYEDELNAKEHQLKETVEEMARVQEQKELDLAELNKTQADMVKLAERINENSTYIHEIEVQNKSLSVSVKELLADKKRLEEREIELSSHMEKKNAEFVQQKITIKKMAETIEFLENQAKATEEKWRRKIQENEAWKAKFFMEKDEAEKLAADCDSKDLSMAKMTQQLQESLQQAVALQKALFTSCEREKCKEEVLHSLRKQHKRTMQELANIRELYDLQNRDLSLYHQSLKDPASANARSSMTGKDGHQERTDNVKERCLPCKSPVDDREEGEDSNSDTNDLSESRTDAQFDADDLLNTCQSRLTNVPTSPRSEIQEYKNEQGQQPCPSSTVDTPAWKQTSERLLHKAPVPTIPRNGLQSEARATPLRSSSRCERCATPPGTQAQHPPVPDCCHQVQSQIQKQQQSHPQRQALLQQGSEESHYSTASAASDHCHRNGQAKCSDSRTGRPDKPQDARPEPSETTFISRVRECQSEGKGHQKDDCQIEGLQAGKNSPRRRGNVDEWRHRNLSDIDHQAKRACRQSGSLSPSLDLDKGQKIGKDSEKFQGVTGHQVEASHNPYPSNITGAPQHRKKSSKHPSNRSVFTKESLGSNTSKQADSSSRDHCLNKQFTEMQGDVRNFGCPAEQGDMAETCVSPQTHEEIKIEFKSPRKNGKVSAKSESLITHGEVMTKDKSPKNHGQVREKCESTRKHGDNLADCEKARKHEDLLARSKSPPNKKTKSNRGKERKQQVGLDPCHGDSNSPERKTALRQESYVVDQRRRPATNGGNQSDGAHARKKLANHSLKEERHTETFAELTGQGKPLKQNAQCLLEEEAKDVCPSTPGFCPSASDVSNVPSFSKLDDELTPADSDGMCRELKRNMKKICRQGSPNSRISYKKCTQAKKESGNSKHFLTTEDPDKTPQALSREIPQEVEASVEVRKFRISREHRTAKSEMRSNVSSHTESPHGKSPVESKNSGGEASHHRRSTVQEEEGKKSSGGGDREEQLVINEKSFRGKKKNRSSTGEGDESGYTEIRLNAIPCSNQSQPSSVEGDANENERRMEAKHFSQQEGSDESNPKHCDESKSTSSEKEEVSLQKRWHEESVNQNMTDDLDRKLHHQHLDHEEHPCVSPRLRKMHFKNCGGDIVSTGSKVTSYYSAGKYGSPNLLREPRFTSKHLHSSTLTSKKGIGTSLGVSMARASGLGLGGSYKSSTDSTCRLIPTTNTSTTYSGRRFFPTHMNSYLSNRLTSWYPGSGSLNYALNNNNDDDRDGTSIDDRVPGDENGDEINDYTDDSRYSPASDRHSNKHYLNTNNNKDNILLNDHLCSSGNSDEENSNNNNNVNPININEISLEEQTCDLAVKPLMQGAVDDGLERSEKRSGLEISHSVHQDPWPSHSVSASQPMCPAGQPCEPSGLSSSSKPFAIRTQPSLYRQLAQIHFSEKTRRYEWVVVPVHLTEAQTRVDPQVNSSGKHVHDPEIMSNSACDLRPTSSIGRLDSRSSEDSCLVSTSVSASELGLLRQDCSGEGSNKISTAAATTTITTTSTTTSTTSNSHSDSGLYSLGSCEGLNICASGRQRPSDGSHPLPTLYHNGLVECAMHNGNSESVIPADVRCGLKPQHCTNSRNSKQKSMAWSSSNVSPVTFTCMDTLCSVACGGSVVTASSSKCHSNSICSVNTSPSRAVLDSFMGVEPSQQEPLSGRLLGLQKTPNVDCQSPEKLSSVTKHCSPNLDGVVKKLDFDDTTLEASDMETQKSGKENEVRQSGGEKKLHFDGTGLENDRSVERELRGTLEEFPVKLDPGNSLAVQKENPYILADAVGKENQNLDIKTMSIESSVFSGSHNRAEDDVSQHSSLCDYFHDISTLSVDADFEELQTKQERSGGHKHDVGFHGESEMLQNAGKPFREDVGRDVLILTEDRVTGSSCQDKMYRQLSDPGYHNNQKFGDRSPESCCKIMPDCCGPQIHGQDPEAQRLASLQHVHRKSPFHHSVVTAAAAAGRRQAWIYEDSVEEAAVHFDERLSSFLEEPELLESTNKMVQLWEKGGLAPTYVPSIQAAPSVAGVSTSDLGTGEIICCPRGAEVNLYTLLKIVSNHQKAAEKHSPRGALHWFSRAEAVVLKQQKFTNFRSVDCCS